jgi:hypothetical protein
MGSVGGELQYNPLALVLSEGVVVANVRQHCCTLSHDTVFTLAHIALSCSTT